MSAAEIIEEIKKLPREEQQIIVAYLFQFGRGEAGKTNIAVSESFKQVADKIFTTNAELFVKLAQ